MKRILVFFLMLSALSLAQEKKTFPEDYFGVYKGDLEIFSVRGKQTLGMEFHLAPTEVKDRYVYTLVYIVKGKRQERKYFLVAKDKEKGIFEVDEDNGISLHAQWLNNTLFSLYEVQGTIITTTERFYEGGMDFEITASSRKSASTTGGGEHDGEEIPEVEVYPINAVQKAILKKAKS